MRTTCLTACLVLALAAPAMAISTGSLDAFDADSEGWSVGGAGTPPAFNGGLSFDGQPGFLTHFSDGGGSNGKLIMWSEESDWTGDYVDAGVTGVSLWADVTEGDDTVMWLGFDGPGGWFFTPGQLLTAADNWARLEFDVTEDAMIYSADSGGTGAYADTFAAVSRFEVFTGPGPVSFASRGDILRGGVSTNVIAFDNIAALSVPSPTAAWLGCLACLGFAGRRRIG